MGVNPRTIVYPHMDTFQNPGYVGCYLHNRFGEANAANYPVFDFVPLPPDPVAQSDPPLLPLPIGPDGLPRFYDLPSRPHVPRYVTWNESSSMKHVYKPCTYKPEAEKDDCIPDYSDMVQQAPTEADIWAECPPPPPRQTNPCADVQRQMETAPKEAEPAIRCVQPWLHLTPNLQTMKEHMGKYKHRHKKSGYGGHFPNAQSLLGGSVYRLTPH